MNPPSAEVLEEALFQAETTICLNTLNYMTCQWWTPSGSDHRRGTCSCKPEAAGITLLVVPTKMPGCMACVAIQVNSTILNLLSSY
jgi:hypothetical protein